MKIPVERRYFSAAERLSRGELEVLQLKKLKRLLAFNQANNPFYRDLWSAAGVSPDDVQSLADYRRFPMITKSDVLQDQLEFPPLGRRVGVPLDQIRKIHLTSGTSGMAKEAWGLTRTDVELAGRGHIQNFHWRGLKPGDVFVSSYPKFFSAGHGAVLGAEKAGLIPFELFGMPTERAFETMRQFPPAMFTFPQPALRRLMEAAGLTAREAFPKLKAVGAGGGSRDRLDEQADYWNARVTDAYGCTQAGNTMGIPCEAGIGGPDAAPMVHFLEERYLIECLDRETGEPAEPGAECEVVLTTLDRVASPAIRYRLHDRLTLAPSGACACGRPFHGYVPGSIGRWDDMMKVRGVNIWPHHLDELIAGCREIAEYRGVVSSENGRDRMLIEVNFSDLAPVTNAWRVDFLVELQARVKAATFVTPEVREAAETFEAFTVKPRRWSDLRQAALRRREAVG